MPSILIGSLENENYLDWGIDAILPNNKNHIPRGEWWAIYKNSFSTRQAKVVEEFLRLALNCVDPYSQEYLLCQTGLDLWKSPIND